MPLSDGHATGLRVLCKFLIENLMQKLFIIIMLYEASGSVKMSVYKTFWESLQSITQTERIRIGRCGN